MCAARKNITAKISYKNRALLTNHEVELRSIKSRKRTSLVSIPLEWRFGKSRIYYMAKKEIVSRTDHRIRFILIKIFIDNKSLLINKYTKHELTIRCQSQRLIWCRSESYNVLLSYNENKINKYKIYREKANYYNI